MTDTSTSETERDLLDWWECASCGETGNSTTSACPECGSMEVGVREGGVDLPPKWIESPADAGRLGVNRLFLHREGAGFIAVEDGEASLVEADIAAGDTPSPTTMPATAESVRTLAERYNERYVETDTERSDGESDE